MLGIMGHWVSDLKPRGLSPHVQQGPEGDMAGKELGVCPWDQVPLWVDSL